MSASDCPRFLYVEAPQSAAADTYVEQLAALAADAGGRVLGAAPAAAVECLEAGTPAAACCLIQFGERHRLTELWCSEAQRRAFAAVENLAGLRVLDVPGLPYVGLPEAPAIPSIASVTPPAGGGPRAYMIIQGNAFDQARMDAYRDIILPMIKALDAYYVAFDLDGGVDTLHGNWPYRIFAISRWPDYRAGHRFWDSDRYQNTAIPQRRGAGEFSVHFFAGLAG